MGCGVSKLAGTDGYKGRVLDTAWRTEVVPGIEASRDKG